MGKGVRGVRSFGPVPQAQVPRGTLSLPAKSLSLALSIG